MIISTNDYKRVLRRRAGAVAVVTMRAGEQEHGLTVTDFCSVSLQPPLVLVCIGNDMRSHAILEAGGAFAVNFLTADQQALSDRFAGRMPDVTERVAGLATRTAVTGAPLLADCLAWLDCRVVQSLRAGDHTIYIGEVLAGDTAADDVPAPVGPLLYFAGDYHTLAD